MATSAPTTAPSKQSKAEAKVNTGASLSDIAAVTASNEPPAAAAEVREGDKVRLRAVHGLLINPSDETRVTPQDSRMVVADAWCVIQVAAGKLVVPNE